MKSTYGTMYYVGDMRKSVAEFKTLLGSQPVYQSPEWTEFAIGDHRLCLHAKQRGGTYRPNGVLIVKVTGVKALFAGLKRRKRRVFGLHEVHPGAWSFNLKDSSGNELSFYGAP
jgi:hypothetical protein